MPALVYFSSVSNNTHRFVERTRLPAERIPLRPTEPFLRVEEPYLLVVPTYGGGNEGGAVPRQVVTFLNDETNRSLIKGVIAAGNTNFGGTYALAGDIVSAKCGVPYLYAFELMGTQRDVERVRTGWERMWR